MGKTKIEYLDFSWSPIAMRCTPCSPGCDHCWHLRMANRLAGNPRFLERERAGYRGDGPPVLTHRLNDPLKIKKPSRIGVMFMGDLFHEKINLEGEQIRAVFYMMASCDHTFFLLTKRPTRMAKYIKSHWDFEASSDIWLGVTVCSQKEADDKIPILLKIPGFKKWISVEPILGAVNLGKLSDPNISWVICGAETGPGARPADNDWFRSLRDLCRAAGVPYFQKATTGPTPEDLMIHEFPK